MGGGGGNSKQTDNGKLVVEDGGWRKRRQSAEGKGSECGGWKKERCMPRCDGPLQRERVEDGCRSQCSDSFQTALSISLTPSPLV